MARLTDDAGETSGNVPSPRSYSGHDHAYYDLGLTVNMTKLNWYISSLFFNFLPFALFLNIFRTAPPTQPETRAQGSVGDGGGAASPFIRGRLTRTTRQPRLYQWAPRFGNSNGDAMDNGNSNSIIGDGADLMRMRQSQMGGSWSGLAGRFVGRGLEARLVDSAGDDDAGRGDEVRVTSPDKRNQFLWFGFLNRTFSGLLSQSKFGGGARVCEPAEDGPRNAASCTSIRPVGLEEDGMEAQLERLTDEAANGGEGDWTHRIEISSSEDASSSSKSTTPATDNVLVGDKEADRETQLRHALAWLEMELAAVRNIQLANQRCLEEPDRGRGSRAAYRSAVGQNKATVGRPVRRQIVDTSRRPPPHGWNEGLRQQVVSFRGSFASSSTLSLPAKIECQVDLKKWP
ncbi:unnamed protein product [Protopolystoma xenopodis]|uniref:Uncharacterized protein n=1 Tax=Protopolystoma xenopodis TaxID=117903 RepID=A0A3S5C5K7_9PLAT|nr:unnamed protein product [Protopolystoma xenopodis]